LQSAYENGNTIVTSLVEGDFNVSGTEDVRLSSDQSFVFSGSDNSSVSVTGANLTLRTLTSGDVNVTSAGTTDVQSSGTVTIDSSSGSIGIAIDAGGTPVDIATGPDASIVQIANSAAAHAIEIGSTTGAAQTNINGGLGNIAIGSTGAIALDANANSSFTVDSTTGQDLELSTTGVGGGDVIVSSAGTTTGRVQVFSIGNTEIDSAAGITLDANAASTFNVNGGDLTLSTTTSGTLTLNSAGALNSNAFDNPAGAGGNAAFRGGSPTAGNNPGGRMDLNGGTGFGSGAGGFASLGGGISGLLLNAPGGACLVGGGNSVSASGVGGQLTLRGGNTTGTGAGGDIVLTPGTSSGGGADGEVTINGKLNVTGAIDPTALQLDPQAVDPGFTTSIWVDVADNELYYTDAAGMATQVSNVAGGGGLFGLPGNIYDSLVFYMDAGDRNSYSGSGTTVTDLIGNATGGTLTGGVYHEGAFQFDGASGNLTFTKGAALDNLFAGGGTCLVIARPYNQGESVGNIVQTGASTGWRIQTDTVDENTARLEFNHNFTGGQLLVETYRQTSDADPTPTNIGGASALPFPFKEGNYNAVAVVYDSDLLANDPTIYFNGTSWTTTLGLQKVSTPTVLPAASDAGDDIVIGNRVADDRTFEGDIAVVLMFNRALTRNEVVQVTSLFAPRFGIGTIGQNGTGLTTAEDVRGQNVLIRGGDGQDEGQGGCVTILAGDTDPTQASGNSGGDILIRAGGRGDPALAGNPGSVTVAGGYGDGAGILTLKGGDIAGNGTNLSAVNTVVIHGSDAVDAPASPSSSSYGGRVLIRGGFSGYTRPCGDVVVRGGEALDSPVGATYGTVEGGDVTVRGGNGLGNRAGGSLTLKSGDAGGAAVTGGVVLATGVNTSTGGAVTPPDIDITCSPCAVTGAGSAVKIQAGDNLASSNGDGGFVTLTAGDSADGDGGSIVLTAGDSASLDFGDPGGSITLAAGNQTGATGGSAGGSLTFTAGDNSGVGPGGGVSFTTGSTPSGSANDPAGSFVVTTGNNTGTVSASGINGGDVTFSLGSTSAPNSNSRGGAFTVTAGNALANSAFARAGGISLTAGNNTGTTAGSIAGSVTITSGSIPNAAGTAGDITLTPGTDVGGAKGNIVFDYATWPIADGAASTSSSLVTDGAGNLSWVGGASAHQLIETITVSTVGGVASVTFSGLDGDTDYRYYITARFAPGAVDIYEVRPNGSAFAANEGRGTYYEVTGVEGVTATFGNQQTSTNGWILHALLAGGDGGTSFVHGYANMHIQARREVGGLSSGGSNSVRQCFGQGTIIDYDTGSPSYTRNRFSYSAGGWYQATPTNITSLQIIGTSNIAQGSEFSLYRILDV
jgi:hypothetical protein